MVQPFKKVSTFKKSATLRLQTFAEAAGLVASVTGASLSLIVGRAAFAVVLGAVALGLFLRISSRAKNATTTDAPLPYWMRLGIALLAVLETGVLVESVNLPVRFDQLGFQWFHWVWVAFACLALYVLQLQILKKVVATR